MANKGERLLHITRSSSKSCFLMSISNRKLCVFIYLSFFLLHVSCKTIEGKYIKSTPESANTIEGLKMGFVADSQLQIKNDTKFDALMKGGVEDRINNVSLRIPPLNKYSVIMLRSNVIKGWNWKYNDNVVNKQEMINYCNVPNKGGRKEAVKGTRINDGSRKGGINFDHLNIGSTTDAYYKSSLFDIFKDNSNLEESKIKPPHALSVSIAGELKGESSKLFIDPVFIERDELYQSIKRVLREKAKNPDKFYTRIDSIFRKRKENTLLMFGFPDKKDLLYELEYNIYNNYVKICNRNLEIFVQYLFDNQKAVFTGYSDTGKISKADIELHLGLYASYKEIKKR